MNYNPITLTQDELDELKKHPSKYRKGYSPYSNWNRNWGNDWGYDNWDNTPSTKRTPHEWVSTLLILSTVYTCKHCGAKKEETQGAYCEETTEF